MNTLPEAPLTAAELLISHLQATAEMDKAALARELHDDLGGLMMAAVMDLASVQQLDSPRDVPARERLKRVKETLESAIDLKRRIIERLRPSILDNFGLVAALKWECKRQRLDSGTVCEERYPNIELHFGPEASIGLFRIAQEALAMSFNRQDVTAVSLHIDVADGMLCMSISDDGSPHAAGDKQAAAATTLASMRHRIRALAGTVEVYQKPSGGSTLVARIELSAALLEGASPSEMVRIEKA
ncbi:MAG: histidine kinase [Pseudomonadota bacterium]|nr:histidine kinase [Pseudomonadota bacterium]